MINKEHIRQVVEEGLAGTGTVVVDISVSNSNSIRVIIDSFDGVNIDECVKINKLIENHFDREIEDYELEVSSFGLGQPFVLPLHYFKSKGREIEVILLNGKKVKAILKNIELTEDKLDVKWIQLSHRIKIKEEGKKKKTEVEELVTFNKSDYKSAKYIPVF